METAVEQGGPAAVLRQIRACQQNGDRTGRFALNQGVENGSWLSVENVANPYLLVTEGTGQFRFTLTTPSSIEHLTAAPLSLLPSSSTEGVSLQPSSPPSSTISLSPVEGVPGLWQGFTKIMIEFDDQLKAKLRAEDCGEEMYVEESFWAAKSLRQDEEPEDAEGWMREDDEEEEEGHSDIEEGDEEMEE